MSVNSAEFTVIFNPKTRQFARTGKLSYFELTSNAKEIDLDTNDLTQQLQDHGGHSNHDDGFYTNFLLQRGFCLMKYQSTVVIFEGANINDLRGVIDGVYFSSLQMRPDTHKSKILVFVNNGKGVTSNKLMAFSPEVCLYYVTRLSGAGPDSLSTPAKRAIGTQKDIQRKVDHEKMLIRHPSLATYKKREPEAPKIIEEPIQEAI